MATTVYLVIGEHGEYPDKWLVAAYTTREQAEDHCRRIHEVLAPGREQIKKAFKAKDSAARQQAFQAWKEHFLNVRPAYLDPKVTIDAEYHVEEVVLVRHVDEFM